MAAWYADAAFPAPKASASPAAKVSSPVVTTTSMALTEFVNKLEEVRRNDVNEAPRKLAEIKRLK